MKPFESVGSVMDCLILFATVFGAIIIWVQLSEAKKASKADFLLHLDEMFREHNAIHRKLFDEDWNPENCDKDVDWESVYSYMGLFERISLLIDDDMLKLSEIKRLYGYRVKKIVNNDCIFNDELKKSPKNWWDFIKLAKSLSQLAEMETEKSDNDKKFISRCKEMKLEESLQQL